MPSQPPATTDLLTLLRQYWRYESFRPQQEKIIRGLDAACQHTRISHDQVRTLASQITADLMDRQVREIETTELGEIIVRHLKDLDTIAYIRFACVYRRFKDVDALMGEIQNISPSEDLSRGSCETPRL